MTTQPVLVLGGASLCATLAVLLVGAQQPNCSFFDWMVPAIVALQLLFALVAGFATGYRQPRNPHSVNAGLRTSLVASLSGFILYGLGVAGLLPAICGEGAHGLGVFILVLTLIFFIAPVAIAGGAAAGWLGGLLARTNRGRIALACVLVAGLAVGLLLLLLQPLGSGVRGIVKVPLCNSYTNSDCVLQPSTAQITVHMPNSEQFVAMTSSDEHGHYQIALKPGKYLISATALSGSTTGPIAVTISANNYLTLELDAK
jgi:hypothetical protein